MSANENEFQFELKEKLYFNEGELVDELMNISLDPEISIEPAGSYISIHGEIELRGEYKKAAQAGNEEELTVDFEDFEAKRFVRSVPTEEEGLMEFVHHFPVDISVPAYRIETIDSIQVEITNFDYEFPANDQLNVTAAATIYGIKEEVDLLQERNEESSETSMSEAEEEESFEFEVRLQGQEKEDETVPPDDTEGPEQTVENTAVEVREEVQESAEKEQEQEYVVQDVSYLTDMFRDEEQENYSRMRICIAQDEDTIETIAERFQVSTLQLIKQNELEDDFEINEGQLLYIPKK